MGAIYVGTIVKTPLTSLPLAQLLRLCRLLTLSVGRLEEGRPYVGTTATTPLSSLPLAQVPCLCRFAALSVGRVEDGQLFCRYHGWRFKGGEEGRCSCNPQAVGAEAEATVLSSSRSRLETYPSQVCPRSACPAVAGLKWLPQFDRDSLVSGVCQLATNGRGGCCLRTVPGPPLCGAMLPAEGSLCATSAHCA